MERAKGSGILVLDPYKDPRWDADLVTESTNVFTKAVEKSRMCCIYVDESGDSIGRYNKEMFWLATRTRHMGHIAHFICHGYKSLAPVVRNQCTHLFIFRVAVGEAKMLADERAEPLLLHASQLGKFEFIYAPSFGRPKKFIVTQTGIRSIRDATSFAVDGSRWSSVVDLDGRSENEN